MNFFELHERLRLITSNRVSQGVSSRSLLARQTGLAQAHISNFLNKRRRLSLRALDRVLTAQALRVEDLSVLDLSILDLSDSSPPAASRRDTVDTIPLVAQSVAMNAPIITRRSVLDNLQVPMGCLEGLPLRRSASRRNWDRFVAVRVAPAQAAAMSPLLRPGSVAVIDRHYNSLANCRPPQPNLYAVRIRSQMFFRYVALESSRLVLRPHALESPVELLELGPQESPGDLIVGRVCLCLAEP